MSRLFALSALAAAGLALGACAPASIKAPTDRRICFHMQPPKDGAAAKFNKLAENVPDLEHCAVELERMRLNFLRLGGSNSEITGSYQGQFLFLKPEGIFTSVGYKGSRYLALVRVGDTLVKPGAAPAPAQ
jgi:hypothetical protein